MQLLDIFSFLWRFISINFKASNKDNKIKDISGIDLFNKNENLKSNDILYEKINNFSEIKTNNDNKYTEAFILDQTSSDFKISKKSIELKERYKLSIENILQESYETATYNDNYEVNKINLTFIEENNEINDSFV